MIRLPVGYEAVDHVLADLVAAIDLVAGAGTHHAVPAAPPDVGAVAIGSLEA